ncbi:MAG: NAD(P)H-dependent oxidoreductase [Sterolibacterium sp.]|jgi:multimeric flavodoxin WrbA|nr:NAD(P)H-dependent oxidoreductase [Sterolibacterium sp.]
MNASRPTLLMIHHTQTGNTGRLAAAALRGAQSEPGIAIVFRHAFEASLEDLLTCQGLLLGTPENFGTMSGALKDFFDRTYYPAEGKTLGLPYAVFVSAGNDGRGAVMQIERIATGYGWKRVAEPLIVRKEITAHDLQSAEELGAALAAGLSLGIF